MDQVKIPSFAELTTLNEDQYNKMMQAKPASQKTEQEYVTLFLQLVNKPFPADWLKDVSVGGGRQIKYAPIYRLEFLATRLFGAFKRREILAEGIILNSVFARVRFHYRIPGTDIWLYEDGAGAAPIQVDSKEDPNNQQSRKVRASELTFLKSTAVQQAYPSAASYALSNAMERIGELFGKNLNKPDAERFAGVFDVDNYQQNNGTTTSASEQAITTTQQPPTQLQQEQSQGRHERTETITEPAVTIIQPPVQQSQPQQQNQKSEQIKIMF